MNSFMLGTWLPLARAMDVVELVDDLALRMTLGAKVLAAGAEVCRLDRADEVDRGWRLITTVATCDYPASLKRAGCDVADITDALPPFTSALDTRKAYQDALRAIAGRIGLDYESESDSRSIAMQWQYIDIAVAHGMPQCAAAYAVELWTWSAKDVTDPRERDELLTGYVHNFVNCCAGVESLDAERADLIRMHLDEPRNRARILDILDLAGEPK